MTVDFYLSFSNKVGDVLEFEYGKITIEDMNRVATEYMEDAL